MIELHRKAGYCVVGSQQGGKRNFEVLPAVGTHSYNRRRKYPFHDLQSPRGWKVFRHSGAFDVLWELGLLSRDTVAR
jgi:hypothetical protein